LTDHLELLKKLDRSLPVLDLACGNGRNGLALAAQGVSVVFADRSAESLQIVEHHLLEAGLPGRTWQVDLEQADINPLAGQRYAAVLGFRYLHRPLFPSLLESVTPGGVVIYQTFTIEQRRFGRPRNPDFLLQPGELQEYFEDWETIHYFEGVVQDPERAIARIVARKP
jgi:SAM-dependent methyltransferase